MAGELLSLLGLGAAGGFLTKDAIDRLSKIGEQSVVGTQIGDVRVPGAMELAQTGLEQSQFRPFTVTSAMGGRFGVTPQVNPVTGEVTSLGATMDVSPQEQALQQSLFGGAGGFYGQAMMPTAAREADVYERIRAVQSPEEQRQRLALEERLASQGRLGVRTAMFGGTPEQFALAQAQEEARNRAALSAIQQAQAEQFQQAQLGQQFLAGSYVPQAQLLNVQQASQLYPQLSQQGQLAGAGLFGETSMTGLEARLIAEQAKANLLGNLGSGLLSGLVSPVAMAGGGVGSVLTSVLGKIGVQ